MCSVDFLLLSFLGVFSPGTLQYRKHSLCMKMKMMKVKLQVSLLSQQILKRFPLSIFVDCLLLLQLLSLLIMRLLLLLLILYLLL